MNPVSIYYGNLFMTCDRKGDVEPSRQMPLGLFFFDTRFLSTWRLTVNGERLQTLSIDDLQYFESRFFLTPGQPTHYVDTDISVFRHRWAGDAFEERVSVQNHSKEPMDLTIRLDIGADFAELLDIKHGIQRHRETTTTIRDGVLTVRYERGVFVRETLVASSQPCATDDDGMTFTTRVEPHGIWHTDLRVTALLRPAKPADLREALPGHRLRSTEQIRQELDDWVSGAPRLRTDYEPLQQTYQRSLSDLVALRYKGLNYREYQPLAGMPWFMNLFGRDAIFSRMQALPFLPQTCVPALRILSLAQGARIDPFRGEEPGKILQELRYDESAAFNERPHAILYAAADTTPLFVILLDEYERWTGDTELVNELRFEATQALDWIDRYADLVGNGYLWYGPHGSTDGTVGQSWKCSNEGVSFRDGRLAGYPQAACEIQGYVYDAKCRAARLARRVWGDPEYADRLEREAAALRERFNRDFWIEDRGYYAAALQADGQQVDSLTSNIGHLLWSGIVEPDRAEAVVSHLLGPTLFSGWGIRTLATTEQRYNPIGYHTGTVWPFDNSIIAWGLRRYGFRPEAARVAAAILGAGRYFGGRLPEALAGYDSTLTKYPVLYASAGAPHATSAGAPLLFLRTLLGLEPYDDHLVVDPAVPEEMGQIELHDIPGRWGRLDALGRGQPGIARR
ncbi:glycogen debranching N-terminal domain-containing protein [Polymorphospora sp. NPDC051019]|uniref:amylo-alpha-1,6-glucosidase n=1 Tax=Polymorphospora sp. NPDC051019 TaxID=3155725 RepID=UPI003419656A